MLEPERRIGISLRTSHVRRVASGFMQAYFSKPAILDIGYRGGDPEAVPVTETAIGIELGYPGYDGVHLPFADASQDTVLAAHVLEHIVDYKPVLAEWLRVLKVGGFLVIMVPHRDLYERRPDLPSRWNGDHKRFYTPARLLSEIEEALPVSTYRIRHLADNDADFDYNLTPEDPVTGGYEIELVIEKISPPKWADRLRYSPATQAMIAGVEALFFNALKLDLEKEGEGKRLMTRLIPSLAYVPPWSRVRQAFWDVDEDRLRNATRSLLQQAPFDPTAYEKRYGDLRHGTTRRSEAELRAHWLHSGYFEGRIGYEWDASAHIKEKNDEPNF